jgi:TolB protein
MRRWSSLSGVFLITALIALPVQGAQDVYLGLQAYSSGGKALGVGIVDFTARSPEAGAIAEKLQGIIREDLLFTQYFTIVENGPAPKSGRLDSVAWGSLGAQVAILGDVQMQGPTVSLTCRIIDVASGKILYEKGGDGSKDAHRRLAHLIADQLTFQLSGQPGIAHSRIAFINNQSRNKEVYVMDYDGANVVRLTFDRSIALLPEWSPDGKAIAFNSYKAQNPDAYLLDFPGGTVRQLSMRQGLNTSPHFSPDGQTLALTLSRGGDPDLYLIDRGGKIIRRLTHTTGVDSSPTFSPNGQQIAFISDRAGSPDLYVVDTTGAGVQRLTYGQWVDAPSWSPKGNLIVYERQRAQGQYDIYTVDPSGRNNQALTQGGARNEGPSWSPDGRFIVFASNRNGRRQLFIMGADGSNPHPVGDIPGQCFDPSWGP